MELKDFISATLLQVVEGIETAQRTTSGANVNADMGGAQLGGNLVNVGRFGVATRVDFDVSVSAETSGGATGKISVFSAGAEGGLQHKNTSANRIAFSVPLRLPDGDKSRADGVRSLEEEEDRAKKQRMLNIAKGIV